MLYQNIERLAFKGNDIPKNITDDERCLFLFLRCLYRDYKDQNITLINAEKEKAQFTDALNRIMNSKKLSIEYIRRWNRCEYLLADIEKSKCTDCSLCDQCRKIARMLDGREDYTAMTVTTLSK